MTFEFDPRMDTIEGKVYFAIGAAGMCWESPNRAGVFDSVQAKEIGDALIVEIRKYITGGLDWKEIV